MNIKYVRVASDLHLEGWCGLSPEQQAMRFLPSDERDAESVLVLAGDICSAVHPLIEFLQAVSKKFARVIAIPGNHEAYHKDLESWYREMELKCNIPNVEYAIRDVRCTELGDVRFIYGTFWADGGSSLAEEARVGDTLNDFHLIRNGYRLFAVSDMKAIHRKHKKQIQEFLMTPFNGKTFVVTHHMPSLELVSLRFRSPLGINGGFASPCDDMLVGEFAPDVWIHGHTHDTIDQKLGDTRIVCNPAGYSRETNGSVYNNFKPVFIEI